MSRKIKAVRRVLSNLLCHTVKVSSFPETYASHLILNNFERQQKTGATIMSRKFASIKIAALFLFVTRPAFGAGDVCVEWKARTLAVLKAKDATWDGERFSVRYFKSSSEKDGELQLVYWTRDGSRRVAYNQSLADLILDERWDERWVTYSVELPEQPVRYQLERVGSYCFKTRPKTFLERVDDALTLQD